jgi:diguanylate cyclase (GGDEF)-like protein
MTSVPRRAVSRRFSGIQRVWLLTAGVTPIAVGIGISVWRLRWQAPPVKVPALVFVALFYLAEITVVHIKFRRDAHSFSMSELPMVLALFFLTPPQILTTQFLGNLMALGITRRQRPVKLAFNLVQLSLQTGITIGVFAALTRTDDPLGPRGWISVATSIACTLVASNLLIGAAIRLSGGTLSARDRATMYTLSAGAGGMNAALGLVAATVLWARPENAWIAAVPSAVLFFAYRAYLAQRLERDRLQSLYEISGELHRLPKVEDAMAAAVQYARSMFDAERAEILLYPDGPDAPGFRTTSVLDSNADVMFGVEPPERSSDAGRVLAGGIGFLIRAGDRSSGMVVPIPGTVPGVMEVRTPLSDIGSFGERDLQLLETLAGHVGVSLENGRLEDSLAKLTELKDQLRFQALHDGLTGLANRTLLRDQLIRALASNKPRRAAVLFLDLDDFKAVNDTFGHEAGDRLLVEVGSRLQSCCRPTDTVARLGGDEFALLLEELASPDDAVAVAKRIISALEEPFHTLDGYLETHASIGIAMIEGECEADDVLKAADEAMYAAKGDGKGTYRVFSRGMRSTQSTDLMTIAEIREAIRTDQFALHYQPIVDLQTGRTVAVEALVRWDHPRRGLIGPDEFIPLSERRGAIGEIGEWVLRTAADTLEDWSSSLSELPVMSINISPAELARPDFVHRVLDVLAARSIDSSLLQVEITESAILGAGATALGELRNHGVRVAIDDFGTGYSALAYLDSLPVDAIKLAGPFMDRLGDQRVRSLVALMLGAGDTMGFFTIAEGIETEEQLETLRSLGCTFGQGFHLGRPCSSDAMYAILASSRATTPAPLRLASNE